MSGTGEAAAEHVLVPVRRSAVPRWHDGGPRRRYGPKTTAARELCALGLVAKAFHHRRRRGQEHLADRASAALAALRAAPGEEAFAAALDWAVVFGRWRAADVRSILAAGD